jgi:hypothetical protein
MSIQRPGRTVRVLPRQERRPTHTNGGVRQAIRLTEVGSLVVLEAVLWLRYRRQRLRWRAQGALARWEHDLTSGQARQAGINRAKRR